MSSATVSDVPRPEYPRPQFRRDAWLNLNGEWGFEMDPGDSGLERGLLTRDLAGRIRVPFCPESVLSGIGHTDFMNAVWYKRRVAVPAAWAGKRLLLHFQAVDYDATVWVNGEEAGRHRGGFTPFTCELRKPAAGGETLDITVRARDNARLCQPAGKQSAQYGNHGCHYTRTTGIWQTVWLEAVPATRFLRPRITPDVERRGFRLELPLRALPGGGRAGEVRAAAALDGRTVAEASVAWHGGLNASLFLQLPAEAVRLWEPGAPVLYDLHVELRDAGGQTVDRFESYAGLRRVGLAGPAVTLNGKPVFQRLVLDQGFYPDGILTAPADADLVRDIELSLAAGFNGARLHQKVFEERFLYHADRLGYLVWGEFPDWGCNQGPLGDNQQPGATYITQWLEELERDYSHPAIIGWCGLNETWQALSDKQTVLDDVTRGMFLAAKAMDPTRPVLDASGYSHRVPETDVYDCHDYEQDPEKFRANHAGLANDEPFMNRTWVGNQPMNVPYLGQPYFVSEFGGIWWNPDAKPDEPSWGYGNRPQSLGEFYARFEGLCRVLLEDPRMFGYCYTQLTDVHQEQNGIFRFDRRPKFDLARLRAIQTAPAACEQNAGA